MRLLKLFKYLKPYRLMVFFVVVSVAGNALAALLLPSLLANIINYGIALSDTGYIWMTGLKMLTVSVVSALFAVSMGYFSARVSAGLGRDLRDSVFKKVESFSLVEFDRFETASLITRTTNDITQIQNFTVMLLRIVITAPITAVGGVILAYSRSPELSRIIFMVIPVLLVLVFVISRKVMPVTRQLQRRVDRVNLVLREKLTGVRVIRAFNTEAHEEARFDQANRDLTQTTMKMQRTMSVLMPGLMLILNLLTVVIVWSGAVQVSYGTMLVGDILAVVQYVMQIMMSIAMFSMVFAMMPRASASAERINEVLTTEPVITDKPDAKTDSTLRGTLEFKGVSFTYPGAEAPALEDISFSTRPGETTAIIGSTGSGKSTLVNLIPRFYDVDSGRVLVDGIDVRDYDQAALRQKIGYVPQKSVLFSGSVEENILYGDADATDERVRTVAGIAQAADFIEEKSDSYQSTITQGGTNVSGGQKQRLSIARAIVRKPEIYIFDDSFSALDFKTESRLRKALSDETKDATVIIVGQRVSTILNAEQILVLDSGKLVGKGTHKELMQSCDVYREIVYSQLSEEEVAG